MRAPSSIIPVLIALVIITVPCQADLAILTPSPDTLAAKQLSVETALGIDHHPRSAEWVDGMISYVELEGVHLFEHGRGGYAASLEAPVLPPTPSSPAVAIGLRDIFNSASEFRDFGYPGRSFYVAAGGDLPRSDSWRYPFGDPAYTAGLATNTGFSHAPYGSLSADLTKGMRQTLEYDGRSINYRLLHSFGNFASVSYERLHGANFVMLQLSTPVGM